MRRHAPEAAVVPVRPRAVAVAVVETGRQRVVVVGVA